MRAVSGIERRNLKVMLGAFAVSLAMLGLGFAAVPLYNLFCRATGYGGTTRIASAADADRAARTASGANARTFKIRFDANVARHMPWHFSPLQESDTVTVGQRDLALYVARNTSAEPVTGTATFNVQPEQAGRYFNKIQCFCFTQQTLDAGEEVRMPVQYYIDPAVLDDPNMDGVELITLSYTFHRAKTAS